MKFSIKAINTSQQLSEFNIEASDSGSAELLVKQQGYVVLSVKTQGTNVFGPKLAKSKFSLLMFSHELQALLKAGLSLMEAMETLREKEHRPQIRGLLDQLMKSLYEGIPFSGALEQLPTEFPTLYVAMIRASERTGDLAQTLRSYVEYQAQIDGIKKKIVSASIYPAILLFVGTLVVMFLMLYVVPKFSALYESKSNNLPWMSELLLAWGRALHAHSQLVISLLISSILLLVVLLTRPKVKSIMFAWLTRIPLINERFKVYMLARFYRTLGMLLKGGIPAVTALEMTADVLDAHFKILLANAIQEIKEGNSISTAMEKYQLTTPVAVRMMRVGERSGQMGEMMQNVGEFYDDDIARWVDWFTKMFEPILMTMIGLIVGIIVVLMYIPIFELAGSLQ